MTDFKSFRTASTPTPDGDGFTIVFDAEWVQGHGIYGGLIFAALIRAAEHTALFSIRNLSVELCAPVRPNEPCQIHCQLQRRGAQTAFYQIHLRQAGEVCVFGSIMTGADRQTTDSRLFIEPPTIPAFDKLKLISSQLMPPFSQQLSYQLAYGHPPFSRQAPNSGGWIAFKNPDSLHDKAMSAALADAWWPSYMSQITQLRAMGTVSFTAHFVSSHSDRLAEPVQLFCETSSCTEGYLSERNLLWDAQGRLLLEAQQRIAVIR